MKRDNEKINRLANRIAECNDVRLLDHAPSMKPSFTMQDAEYSCGAPACILGHNRLLHSTGIFCDDLADSLGISLDQAEELCCPRHAYAHYLAMGGIGFITKDHAVAVLRNLADTGDVDWKIKGCWA